MKIMMLMGAEGLLMDIRRQDTFKQLRFPNKQQLKEHMNLMQHFCCKGSRLKLAAKFWVAIPLLMGKRDQVLTIMWKIK